MTKKYAGRYLLLTTYADLSDKELEMTKEWDETPLETLAVDETFLRGYAEEKGYPSLDCFLNSYTYDGVEGIAAEAESKGTFAFSYHPDLEKKYRFPKVATADMLQALVEFMEDVSVYDMIIKLLPQSKETGSKYFACDYEIITPDQQTADVIADFLEAIGVDALTTGFYDPEEDRRNNEIDALTGHGYVSA
ncbi:MAG: hypothetical protein HFE94_08240 [Acutalibacter sp.]|nr:hypothetical protein [Acutalibacter sp.]